MNVVPTVRPAKFTKRAPAPGLHQRALYFTKVRVQVTEALISVFCFGSVSFVLLGNVGVRASPRRQPGGNRYLRT